MSLFQMPRRVIVAVTIGLLFVCSCTNSKKKADDMVAADTAAASKDASTTAKPAAIEVETLSSAATVQSIDYTKRTVTLKNDGGAVNTYKCGKDVVNFNQIKVGDRVKAQILESLAVYVGKAGAPNATNIQTAALAPKGAKPGMILADTTEVTAKIIAVDAAGHAVTVTGPLGKTRSFSVDPSFDLAGVQVGDDVIVRYTESFAIVVEQSN